jgi:hypothetical protein
MDWNLLLGPFALTVGAVSLLAVVGRLYVKAKDQQVAAADKRGDEWKSAYEEQVEINATQAAALNANTTVLNLAIERGVAARS